MSGGGCKHHDLVDAGIESIFSSDQGAIIAYEPRSRDPLDPKDPVTRGARNDRCMPAGRVGVPDRAEPSPAWLSRHYYLARRQREAFSDGVHCRQTSDERLDVAA